MKIEYVSLGENCLADNILNRYHLKAFSTPYSHGRSNIDCALALEKCKYRVLLNQRYLHYEMYGKKQVVRNSALRKCDDIFISDQKHGFEFTHHDVIGNAAHLKSYSRKVKRMRRLRRVKGVVFFTIIG